VGASSSIQKEGRKKRKLNRIYFSNGGGKGRRGRNAADPSLGLKGYVKVSKKELDTTTIQFSKRGGGKKEKKGKRKART